MSPWSFQRSMQQSICVECCRVGGSSESASARSSTVWPALADALLMFPLTKPVRLALLHLLCSQQVGYSRTKHKDQAFDIEVHLSCAGMLNPYCL